MDATKFKLKVLYGSSDPVTCQLYPRFCRAISTKEHEHDVLLLAQIHHFSDEKYHPPEQSSYFCYYRMEHGCFDYHDIIPMVIANDTDDYCKPHVTLIFRGSLPYVHSVAVSFVISVIDRSDHERYAQSYSRMLEKMDLPKDQIFLRIDKFLSRESLLNNADELLPNDCLKLRISLNFQIRFIIPLRLKYENTTNLLAESSRESNLDIQSDQIPTNTTLFLDSALGQFLCKNSKVFRTMAETEMVEKKKRSVRIPGEHLHTLKLIFEILMSTDDITIRDMDEIYDMRILADYYDIEGISQECRDILKSFMYSQSSFARKHARNKIRDLPKYPDHFRELIENFIQSSGDIFPKRKHKPDTDMKETKNDDLETKWVCTALKDEKGRYFVLSRKNNFQEMKPNLDFYV